MRKTTFFEVLLITVALLFAGGAKAQGDYDYTEVLTKSIQFYDAQICGPQPDWSRAGWREDCHLNDGSDIGKNLTGGWHDAGDHTKFNYVSAQATRILAWSYLEYQKSFDDTGNRTALFRHLRLSGDFMIKLHPSPNVFYAQIGRAKTGNNPEHNEWVPPSEQSARIDRSVTQIDTGRPGTHMAASNAAAFASLSIIFQDEDPAYSNSLLQHAIDLYNFGDNNRGDHYDLLDGEPYPTFNSSDPDLMVGAIWLYKATGEQRWLDKALTFFDAVEFKTGWTMHYGDHQYEGFLLLAQILGQQRYYDAVERWVDRELDEAPFTDAGLYFRTDFLAASFAQAMAFGAYFYADLRGDNFSKSQRYKDFAFRQIAYVLGDNPRTSSYVSGFGNNFPKRIHHRGASGVAQNAQVDDLHELTGALVGGPFQDDSWNNQRTDVKRTEPAISNQAFFVGMAAMVLKENGTQPQPSTDSIIAINAPGTVTQGQTVTVRVDFEASTDRDIIVMLQRDGQPDFETFRKIKRDVSAGTGTLNIDVAVPADLPVANDEYQFQVYITPNGGDWPDRLSNIRRENVDALAANPVPDNANTVVVRAKGVSGEEIFELLVDDGRFGDFKKVSKGYINYVFENVPSGSRDIKVKYVNDGPGLDMQVDHIKIGNTVIQSEAQSINTAVWQNGSCGGSNSEIMNCNGEIRFGARNIGASTALKTNLSPNAEEISTVMAIYPNPATEGHVTITGPEVYDLEVTDLSGKTVLIKTDVSSTEQLEVVDLPPGMYVFETRNLETGEKESRKVLIR